MDHEEWLEFADIYALDALDGNDLARFEAHLSACSRCRNHLQATREMLLLGARSLEPVAPPLIAKKSIVDRIEKEKLGFLFALAHEGDWRETSPGLTVKVLNIDSTRRRITTLVRMAPGARYENHRHTQVEELFVLEGSCYCGGRLLRKGDYHRAETGSIHLDTHTEKGSLMLVISAAQNETLA